MEHNSRLLGPPERVDGLHTKCNRAFSALAASKELVIGVYSVLLGGIPMSTFHSVNAIASWSVF